MPRVTHLLETSKPTAGKAIELLIAAGILAEVGNANGTGSIATKTI